MKKSHEERVMALGESPHSSAMTYKAHFAAALSLCAAACFAKTTSLGSASDGADQTEAGATPDANASETMAFPDSSRSSGSLGKNAACQIGTDGQAVVPCNNGELGVGTQYCKSDNSKTCGSPAHCTDLPQSPSACVETECGCDKQLRCNGASVYSRVDVAPPGFCSLACGSKTCDGTIEYCWHGSGGAHPLDGGTATVTYECHPVPTECKATHTCKCLLDHSGSAGACKDTGGYLDFEVFLP